MKKLTQNGIKMMLILALLALGQMNAFGAKKTAPSKTVPPPPDPTPELPADPALTGLVKVELDADALYKVTAAQLAVALGGTASQAAAQIADGKIAVRSLGHSISWLAASDNSAVYFVGQKIDNKFGGQNVYWLDVGVAGMQVSSTGGRAPKRASPGGLFVENKSFEEDVWSVKHLCSDPNADLWSWGAIYTPSTDYAQSVLSIVTPGVAAGGTATIRVNLKGGIDTAASPDHRTRVYINGVLVGEGAFDGTQNYVLTASVSQSLLNDGANDVTVESVAGSTISIVYIDSIDVTYLRSYEAVDGSLILQGSGNSTVTAEGFTGSDVEVFNLSNPNQPVLVGATKLESVSGSYCVSFTPDSASTPYLAVRLSSAAAPASIAAYVPAGLLDVSNAAEYVVIAPDVLVEAASGLTAYRQSQGMSTKIVRIGDIYDEFNEGIYDPMAMQAFLEYALSHWAVAPRYVVLAGQGSYDYKNVTGNGDCLIPGLIISTAFGLEVSDSRIADIDDDLAPEVAIGRLPVLTAVELDGVVAKIRAYEAGGAWKSRMQLITDNPDSAGDYIADAEEVSQLAASWMSVDKAYLGQQGLADVRNAALGSLSSGCGILNYVGHGYSTKLASEGIIQDTDLAALSNVDNAPVMLSMSCDVGEFGVPGGDSLSEKMVAKTNGGAVAVWANSTGANSGESQILSTAFHQALASGTAPRLGDAIKAAQENYSKVGHSVYQGYCYNLLGDPATLIDGGQGL